jgi:hypothetical protein
MTLKCESYFRTEWVLDIAKFEAMAITNGEDGANDQSEQPPGSDAPHSNHPDDLAWAIVTPNGNSSDLVSSSPVDGLADVLGKFAINSGTQSDTEDNRLVAFILFRYSFAEKPYSDRLFRELVSEFKQKPAPTPIDKESIKERMPVAKRRVLDASQPELFDSTYCRLASPSADDSEHSEFPTNFGMTPGHVQKSYVLFLLF